MYGRSFDHRRLSGHRRHLAVERFLLQGRDTDRLLRLQPPDGLGDDGHRRLGRQLYLLLYRNDRIVDIGIFRIIPIGVAIRIQDT